MRAIARLFLFLKEAKRLLCVTSGGSTKHLGISMQETIVGLFRPPCQAVAQVTALVALQ
ncbi:hypothetical protein [Aneurinibacillus migulanus]|uniref:hypothetical protein n=1 Tax=Aneurinibacillus migulanus TaxID=47500 RepID=UPI000AE27E0A|nr:hypothetical protein [Aneurinibacillus migulanus]